MVKIQLDLNAEQNKKASIHKIKKSLKTKEAAILDIIDSIEVE